MPMDALGQGEVFFSKRARARRAPGLSLQQKTAEAVLSESKNSYPVDFPCFLAGYFRTLPYKSKHFPIFFVSWGTAKDKKIRKY